jgi:hypothetical protein
MRKRKPGESVAALADASETTWLRRRHLNIFP